MWNGIIWDTFSEIRNQFDLDNLTMTVLLLESSAQWKKHDKGKAILNHLPRKKMHSSQVNYLDYCWRIGYQIEKQNVNVVSYVLMF